MKKIKVALVIGHNKQSQGARNSTYGETEYKFNEQLVEDIFKNIKEMTNDQVEFYIVERYDLINTLVMDLNTVDYTFIISFHCNAFDTNTFGCEFLYYHKSKYGEEIAEILNSYISKLFNNRGIKPKTSEDRGGYLLANTTAPCVIAETFFIDNDEEWSFANKNYNKLLELYCNAIIEICKKYGYKDIDNLKKDGAKHRFSHDERTKLIKEHNKLLNDLEESKLAISEFIKEIIYYKE